MEIKNVTVFGSGLMGAGIVQVSAHAGYNVTMVDVEQDFIDGGMKRISASLKRVLRKKHENKDDADAEFETVFGRIKATTSRKEGAEGADLVVEAITENIDLKQELFKFLDENCPSHAIFASNTSSLPIRDLAKVTGRSDKIGGLHFFNPVPVMRLVEVIKSDDTSDNTHAALMTFGEAVGKKTVSCKDTPGFVVNRLLVPYLIEAVRMLERGDASAEDIDAAMKLGCGYPMGPMGLLDYVGLDTTKFILDGWHEAYPDEDLFAPSKLLDRLVEEGKLGRKSGEGFYNYKK
ncbi:3-hydroxybutyryl-CoA dehydrogenase [bacterium]|nr:3-hydroxybutyryl-CoA dehydrogenase [bacterium]|tara:strand:- start:833 stop:1705 length:873 start_codon:yes stop_codon:yes gene_type:complete